MITMCIHYVRRREKKLAMLAMLSKFMSFKQKRILMKTFVESQFNISLFNRQPYNFLKSRKEFLTLFYVTTLFFP